MATLTIRNLAQDVHDSLRMRAARHRRSMEAEARTILEATVALPEPTFHPDDVRRIQDRAIAALGGAEAKRGAVERFLAERRADWPE